MTGRTRARHRRGKSPCHRRDIATTSPWHIRYVSRPARWRLTPHVSRRIARRAPHLSRRISSRRIPHATLCLVRLPARSRRRAPRRGQVHGPPRARASTWAGRAPSAGARAPPLLPGPRVSPHRQMRGTLSRARALAISLCPDLVIFSLSSESSLPGEIACARYEMTMFYFRATRYPRVLPTR
jgi:hypothetical protein